MPFSDRAARQRQRDARREIEADQQSDIGKTGIEFGPEQRRDRRDALELKRHGEPHGEQNGQNAPAISQRALLDRVDRHGADLAQ